MDEKQVALLEEYKSDLENEKYGAPVTDEADQLWMSLWFENTKSALVEAGQMVLSEEDYGTGWTSTGANPVGTDTIGNYAKLIMPVLRRMAPELIAPAFFGTQPLNGPSGFVVAMKSRYVAQGKKQIAIGKGVILVLDNVALAAQWAVIDDTTGLAFNAATNGHVTQATSTATGFLRHKEDNKILIEVVSGTFLSGTGYDVSVASGTDSHAVTLHVDHEAGYNTVLTNYTHGPQLPVYNSDLGANTSALTGIGKEIPEMGIDFKKTLVEPNTRKVKATFPLEMEQDLKHNVGLNAKAELIRIMQQELLAEQNREMVDLLNSNALQLSSYNVDTQSDGRWHLEKIRGLKMKIQSQAQQIFIRSRRGVGNKLLVSPNVLVALMQLPEFKLAPYSASLTFGRSHAGKLGSYDVYVDTFADVDYCTIAYRGGSNLDAGYYWCPYIGLLMEEAKTPDTLFDRKIGFMTRYGTLPNPFGADNYFSFLPITGLSAIGI